MHLDFDLCSRYVYICELYIMVLQIRCISSLNRQVVYAADINGYCFPKQPHFFCCLVRLWQPKHRQLYYKLGFVDPIYICRLYTYIATALYSFVCHAHSKMSSQKLRIQIS